MPAGELLVYADIENNSRLFQQLYFLLWHVKLQELFDFLAFV